MIDHWILPPEADLLSAENRGLVLDYIISLLEAQYSQAENEDDELIDVSTMVHVDALRHAFADSVALKESRASSRAR